MYFRPRICLHPHAQYRRKQRRLPEPRRRSGMTAEHQARFPRKQERMIPHRAPSEKIFAYSLNFTNFFIDNSKSFAYKSAQSRAAGNPHAQPAAAVLYAHSEETKKSPGRAEAFRTGAATVAAACRPTAEPRYSERCCPILYRRKWPAELPRLWKCSLRG